MCFALYVGEVLLGHGRDGVVRDETFLYLLAEVGLPFAVNGDACETSPPDHLLPRSWISCAVALYCVYFKDTISESREWRWTTNNITR